MKLTILLTSDIHGSVFPIDYKSGQEKDIGLLKVASLIKREREKNPNTISIDLGDTIQGSILAQYLYQVEKTPEYLYKIKEDIGFDLEVLGNHEFNYGLDYLNKGINSSKTPVLTANIVDQDGKPVYGDYMIIEKAGIKVGIIGLTSQYVKNRELEETIKGLNFLPAKETAEKYIKLLKDKVDVLILAYHGGFEKDLVTGKSMNDNEGENEGYEILKNLTGFDVLLTGHQHRKIAEIIDNVAVLQAGFKGQAIGKVDLYIDENKNIVNKEVSLLSAHDVDMDQRLFDKYSYINEDLNIWMNQLIGKTQDPLKIDDPFAARLFGNAYANFINKLQLEYSKADISSTPIFRYDAPGFENEIRRLDIINNYPYNNTLAVIKISGRELKEALIENSMYFELDKDGKVVINEYYLRPKPKHYNYDFYYNLDFKIDLRKSKEERLVFLRYNNKMVQDDDEFELATNHYRALGAGEFSIFKGKEIIRSYEMPINSLMIEYIKKEGFLKADLTKNFEFIS
jgi:2',3'-cyclic-nucleotide 2'-phosphodiesterase/3'-nucleotidase